jgi:hypothetical protein
MTDADEFDWSKDVPDFTVDLAELDDDGHGFVYRGEPFSGIAISYYGDGQVESLRPCLNGFPHGYCRWWHDNGQLSQEWTAFAGMGHGWGTTWNEDGVVVKKRLSEFGRALEWAIFGPDGAVIETGTNRADKLTLEWVEKYRRLFPKAPVV